MIFKKPELLHLQSATKQTALSVAAAKGRAEMVSFLLQQGLDPNHTDKQGNTPLSEAVSGGHPEVVRILLNAGVDPNLPIIDSIAGTREHLLYHAIIMTDQVEVVRALLEGGADPNSKVYFSTTEEETSPDTFFHFALSIRNVIKPEIIKLLVKSGVDLNQPDSAGFTPVEHLTLSGEYPQDLQFLQILLEAGADPNQLGQNEDTPLINAICGGEIAAIEILLEAGAEINKITPSGDTALKASIRSAITLQPDAKEPPLIQKERLAITRLLIEKGADVHLGNPSPLVTAQTFKYQEAIDLLKQHGAKN